MAAWNLTTLQGIRATRRIDSEFFHPNYVVDEQRTRNCETDDLGNMGVFVPGPFGSAFHVQNYDFKSPYRYIRGRDVKPFFLLNDDNRYIPEEDFNRLKQYGVRRDDLMISVVGTLGNVAICTEGDTPAMFSCKSTLFRSTNADPYFLVAYLSSVPGQSCLLRRQRGAIQGGLNIEDLKSIPVPRFGGKAEGEIASKVRDAHSRLVASRSALSKAQELLDGELGLDKLSFLKPVGYTTRFSELASSHRADAEYFHVGYEPFISAAKKYPGGWAPLWRITARTMPSFDATKHERHFEYIEIGDIDIGDGSYATTRINAKELPANAKVRLNGGEILISEVRPTRGAIAIVNDELGDATVCSGAFYVCTVMDIKQREIIWLYLRSMKKVLEKYCGGTSYPTIDSQYISKFPVPLFESALSGRVHKLVVESKKALRESRTMLADAKARVEALIGEAIQS
jgi:type I restriction enzyme S subunit